MLSQLDIGILKRANDEGAFRCASYVPSAQRRIERLVQLGLLEILTNDASEKYVSITNKGRSALRGTYRP